MHDGITGAAVGSKQPVYAPDVSQDSRYICSAQSTRSELAIPLMVRGEVVGVLDCQSDRVGHFDRETIELLTLFSTQASIALQNARLYSLERPFRCLTSHCCCGTRATWSCVRIRARSPPAALSDSAFRRATSPGHE